MDRLPRLMISRISVMPLATASSTTYWITGLSTTGSISLGTALEMGRKRVPNPAAGITALRTLAVMMNRSRSDVKGCWDQGRILGLITSMSRLRNASTSLPNMASSSKVPTMAPPLPVNLALAPTSRAMSTISRFPGLIL